MIYFRKAVLKNNMARRGGGGEGRVGEGREGRGGEGTEGEAKGGESGALVFVRK